MFDLAPDSFDCRGNHVAAIGDGRSAKHDHQFGAGIKHLIDRARERSLIMRHAPLGKNGRAGRRNARCRDLERLLNDLGRKPGSSVDTTPILLTL